MSSAYKPLPSRPAQPTTPISVPEPPPSVTMDDPAVSVMTDLEKLKVVTITPDVPIDEALSRMIHAQVRMLIVVDKDQQMIGLITARDIMGERPLSYSSRERVPRQAIKVGDIMRSGTEIQVMALADVVDARVGDVVASLKEHGHQHGLVVQRDRAKDADRVRGIFSLVKIGRQLGIEIHTDARVQSFAEVERLLNPL
jgi:hypothetical protein